jgi:hypothetical protein
MPTRTSDEIASDEEAVMLVTRVEDYDMQEGNDFWKLDANKSFPREGLVCAECKFPVVMSNGLYESYKKNPHNPKAICNRCMFAFLGTLK